MKKFFYSIQKYNYKSDIFLWIFTISAIIYSLILIASMQRSGNYNYLKIQTIAVFIGFLLAITISYADYHFFINKWYLFAIIAFVLAFLVFIFGIQVEGTDDTAWLQLPFGFTIQPSEFIKICFIITLSKHLSYLKQKNELKNITNILFLTIHAIIPMTIIHIQGDDGAVLIFAVIFIIMTFIAGIELRYFLILGLAILTGIPLIWHFFMNNEHRNRFIALFNIDGNAITNYGWQQYQGKVSIASGMLTGSGFFNGARVESGIVPEQENDFIFTVAGEETGFIGCIILIFILFAITIKIILNCKRAKDFEGKFICSGVFAMIASQIIINLGMVLGFFPVIGITLPLFSAGGTSVICILICIGLIQSVRRYSIDDMNTIVLKKNKYKHY